MRKIKGIYDTQKQFDMYRDYHLHHNIHTLPKAIQYFDSVEQSLV